MSLRTMRCALACEVRAERSRVVFDRAAERRPELAALGQPTAVLQALTDQSAATLAQRECILGAVLREHQQQPQPVWSAFLLTAYVPMLVRLRARLRGGGEGDRDDLDQLVVAAFLEVARVVRAEPGRISIRLRSATARTVFRAIARERRQSQPLAEYGGDGAVPDAGDEAGTIGVVSALDEFIDHARGRRREERSAKLTRGGNLPSRPASRPQTTVPREGH